ncbi:MAG: hypothetical protein U0992_22600 [Planctomycetaceae bacterium]
MRFLIPAIAATLMGSSVVAQDCGCFGRSRAADRAADRSDEPVREYRTVYRRSVFYPDAYSYFDYAPAPAMRVRYDQRDRGDAADQPADCGNAAITPDLLADLIKGIITAAIEARDSHPSREPKETSPRHPVTSVPADDSILERIGAIEGKIGELEQRVGALESR